MKKRLLSALCAVMLLICAVPMASAQTGDAARRADALTVLHILAEEPDRDLTAPATRAQAAVLLVRLSGGEKHPDTDGWFAGFRDVPEWARTAVNYAARRGWVSGVSNVSFAPNGALNADAWCAMLLRMLGYTEKAGDFEISDAAAFAWKFQQVQKAVREKYPVTLTADAALLLANMKDAQLAPLEAAAEDAGVDPTVFYTTRTLAEAFLEKCDRERIESFAPLFEGSGNAAQAARAALLPNTFLQALVCRALTGPVLPEVIEE